MREVCFLIGASHEVLWSDAGASPVALADSRDRWEAIWFFRNELLEIAHSHPVGPRRACWSGSIGATWPSRTSQPGPPGSATNRG